MSDKVSDDAVRRAIGEIRHPEINSTLAELGMIRDVKIGRKSVNVTLALPFMGIPKSIKEILITRLRNKIEDLGLEIEVDLTQMTQGERRNFFNLESEKWEGL